MLIAVGWLSLLMFLEDKHKFQVPDQIEGVSGSKLMPLTLLGRYRDKLQDRRSLRLDRWGTLLTRVDIRKQLLHRSKLRRLQWMYRKDLVEDIGTIPVELRRWGWFDMQACREELSIYTS